MTNTDIPELKINVMTQAQYDGLPAKDKRQFYFLKDAKADYVVESKKNPDGSWYRKYKSGWLEQGGVKDKGSVVADYTYLITLLKPFNDINYTILLTAGRDSAKDGVAFAGVYGAITTTTIPFQAKRSGGSGSGGVRYLYWYACGMGA